MGPDDAVRAGFHDLSPEELFGTETLCANIAIQDVTDATTEHDVELRALRHDTVDVVF